ncbi:MAG: hypothetical protein KDB18_10165 [Salinibacterium sp.]|nr:hypothetical protein [Salinibacterium sp.]
MTAHDSPHVRSIACVVKSLFKNIQCLLVTEVVECGPPHRHAKLRK